MGNEMQEKTDEEWGVEGVDWEWTDVDGEKERTRRTPGSLDERYIELFCNHPERSKGELLIEAGYVGSYPAQEAYRVHKRLREKIEERLDEETLDGGHLGFQQLVYLVKNAESESVKAKCAKDLMEFSGRKAIDRVNVKVEQSDEEREDEIRQLQEELKDQLGTGQVH